MALRTIRRKSVDGLDLALSTKLGLDAVLGTPEDVIAANNGSTVPSTAALNTMLAAIQSSVSTIVDDNSASGNTSTWSIDKIKAFVASVDDSVVVSTLDERDAIVNPTASLVAFVLDTTGDSSLGANEGQSASYIHTGTAWVLNQLLRTDIDVTPFVKYTDVVDNLTAGGTNVPLSAEQGKILDAKIASAASASNVKIVVDGALVITGNGFTTSKLPLGMLIGATAEVEVAPGVWDIVDVAATATPGSFLLLPSVTNEYDMKTCRVSYLAAA